MVKDPQKQVAIYTDGACSGNPGPGGWAAVLIYKGHEKEICGFEPDTTNNRMELMAVLKALRALKERCIVDLYTDSAYVCNAYKKSWMTNWQSNGWMTYKKKPVENKDLWMQIYDLSQCHEITWHKVAGHADCAYNNRCDQLAREQIAINRKQTEDNSGEQ